jgi:hypothetical protein
MVNEISEQTSNWLGPENLSPISFDVRDAVIVLVEVVE